MKVLIIGANGKVGRRIARRMASSPQFEPTAFIRKEEQRAIFRSMDVPTIVESLESSAEQLAEAMQGFQAVVFTAGSGASTGYDKTMEIDLYGAIKSIDAAQSSGIGRYVMISAARTDQPESWSAAMKPYYIAKHLADRELTNSGLDYTILRPVRLTDDEEAGKIMIATEPQSLNGEIPREAVAETVLQVLQHDATAGKILEMSEGGQEIEEAIRALVGSSS